MTKVFESKLAQRQTLACNILTTAAANSRLAHAYLFVGRALSDKLQVAKFLAAYLNCSHADKVSRGSCLASGTAQSGWCQNCRWLDKDEHPQAWLPLTGEGLKSGRIAVEKSRILAAELIKTSTYTRCVVIPEAKEEIFHRPAANALLKTIEEPGPNLIFFLFATNQAEVLPTIVSRCQVVPFKQVGRDQQKDLTAQLIDDMTEGNAEDLKKQELIRQLKTSITKLHNQKHGHLCDWLDFANQLKELSGVSTKSSERIDPKLVIDLVVEGEIEALQDRKSDNPQVASYLQEILKLSETSKSQFDHFVSGKASLESFAIAVNSLRDKAGRF